MLMTSVAAGAAEPWKNRPVVRPAVIVQVQPFELRDVRLLDSPFKQAMETDKTYLLQLEADRLLSWFRKEAGLAPKGQVYPGWESQGVAGHALGHYLSAVAQMWQATGDEMLLQRVNTIVDELAACQQANGNGYVGAIPNGKKIFAEIAAGDIRATNGFTLNGGWVPWYTMHKLFAGLLDAYQLSGNDKAKDVALRLADWAESVVKDLPEDKMQLMLSVEQGGMAESLAELYALTGEPRYLALAKKFRHRAVFDPAAAGRDALTGRHANTNIPKFIGYQRIYELTGEPEWGRAARNFWTFVARDRSFVIGGNSTHEYFFPIERFPQQVDAPQGPETCNTYNMLKLSAVLFQEKPDAAVMDFYERAVYNHILASEHPHEPGSVVYYTTMRPGGYRGYSRPFSDFWCCVGTGMENHARYGHMIYARAGMDRLFVNLFIPSELQWKDAGLSLTQDTTFPNEPRTRLRFKLDQPRRLTIAIRYPGWVEPGALKLTVNDSAVTITARPGEYAEVTREWKNGDVLNVELPLKIRIEMLPHSDDYAAILYGPVVLAGQLGRESLTEADLHRQIIDVRKTLPVAQTPVFLAAADEVAAHIEPVAGQPLTFRTTNLAKPADVTLAPFYATHDQRYAIYWQLTTPAKYEADLRARAEQEKRLLGLAARTVDRVAPGEQQPEVDHKLQSEKSTSGHHLDRGWRDAREGGWFSYELKVPPDRPVNLLVTYWGEETGPRTFDILIDGQKIATQTLRQDKPGEFFDLEYRIPVELTRGKEKVTVRFQAHPDNLAGGIFDLRIVHVAEP